MPEGLQEELLQRARVYFPAALSRVVLFWQTHTPRESARHTVKENKQ